MTKKRKSPAGKKIHSPEAKPRHAERAGPKKEKWIVEEPPAPIEARLESPWLGRLIKASVLILPFLTLYWLAPMSGKSIGNDYQNYWINAQLELRYSLREGVFPLYVPAFGVGQTAPTLTLGQLWHPISWIAAAVPGYWDGHATAIGTFLRLLTLGATHLALFLLLMRLKIGRPVALALSFITVYNLRMLEMFRYGTSLENYTAHLLLCAAVLWHWLAPERRRLGAAAIALSTWLLLVGGHPQIMYFGILGSAFIAFVAPFFLSAMTDDKTRLTPRDVSFYYLRVGLAVAAGFVLALPYILPYYFEFLINNPRADGMTFAMVCDHQDSIAGVLSNFYNPFQSDVHGAFGGSALLIPAMLTPLFFIFARGKKRDLIPVGVVWIFTVAILLLTMGSNGGLYEMFWMYFPFTKGFRVPGRVGLVLPILFMLLLAWTARRSDWRFRAGDDLKIRVAPWGLAAIVGLAIFLIAQLLPAGDAGGVRYYTPDYIFKDILKTEISSAVRGMVFAAGFLSLVAMAAGGVLKRWRSVAMSVLLAGVLLQTTLVLRHGSWISKSYKKPTYEAMRAKREERATFQIMPGGDGVETKTVIDHLNYSFVEPTMAHIARRHTTVASPKEAYIAMAGERSFDHIYVEGYKAAEPVATAVADGGSSLTLTANSFNRYQFEVETAQPGFFVFSFPYSPRWRATVDGEPSEIYRCNGFEHAVRLSKAGSSVVEIRYHSPSTLVGVLLAALIMAGAGVWLFASVQSRRPRLTLQIAAPVLCIVLAVAWRISLYAESETTTRYSWSSEPEHPELDSRQNLAYGKAIRSCPIVKTQPAHFNSSRGVDGQRGPDVGFAVQAISSQMAAYYPSLQKDDFNNAWWEADLARVETLGEIVIYKHQSKLYPSAPPIDILVSNDQKTWRGVTTIAKDTTEDHWRVPLKNIQARFVRLRSRGAVLALAEVEIYAPKTK